MCRFNLEFLSVCLVMLAVASGGHLQASGPKSRAVTVVHRILIHNEGKTTPEKIRKVITLRKGEPFSEEKLQESLDLLKQWGRFEKVEAEPRPVPEGIDVVFKLLEGLMVSRVDFTGHFPYLTSRIQRNVGIRVGQIFNREQIIDEVKKLKRFFEREGYFATTVRVREKTDSKKGVVAVTFRIRKGPRLRWRKIDVAGNTVFPDGFFRTRINSWFPYQPARLRRSLEKMKQAYKEQGYARARIRVQELVRDFKNNKVDIKLEVAENKQLEVHFHGYWMVHTKTLKEAITFFREEAYDEYEVGESVAALQELYHSKGFLSVKIEAKRTFVADNKIRVDFFIEEGPQTLVKKITIAGKERLKESRITKQLSLQEAGLFTSGYLSGPALVSDQKRIPHLLRLEGFPQGQLEGAEIDQNLWHDRATVRFVIAEGPREMVSAVRFEGVQSVSEKRLRRIIELKRGKPLSEFAIHSDGERLVNYYADQGHPYASVTTKTEPAAEGDGLLVTFQVTEGLKVRVGDILIIGIAQTRPSTIRSAIPLRRGEPFSRAKLAKGESRLRKLGSFDAVDIDVIGLAEQLPTVHLLVKVQERKHLVFDIKASYSTDDKLSGSFVFTNLNVLGFGKRMNVLLTGGFDLRRGEWNFIDPHLLGGDFEMVVGTFVQDEDRPSFNVTDFGGSLSFLREIGRTMSVLAKYEVQRSIFRGGTPSPDEETADRTLPHGSLSFSYDSRDYFADPKEGFFGLALVDYFNPFVGSGANFFKLSGQLAYYLSPHRRFTFVNSLRAAGIVPATSGAVIPRSELLFIGGDYSIRGFAQDHAGPVAADGTPVGQQFTLLFNSELQFRLAGNLKVAAFFDTASAASDVTVNAGTLRHSAGLGLRYITPVGPVRLDYGIKLDPRAGESFGRLHFTFGYAF